MGEPDAPQTPPPVEPRADPATIRRAHLWHEGWAKDLGCAYLVGSAVLLPFGLWSGINVAAILIRAAVDR